ncbi:2-oxoacid:acceptor oxidoreductase family protein [Myxococcota bacterium]|nr:2-oxoacid:acceptor oxidoreductase family protein [Myxococcota bacterium]MBU1381261.1 2-oxoacid:acceptor oxidoreductase family protein [Myxococcota bacterium]MBU1499213.1 2-oxoacid:acceptor oxidoreductase family protein [Myxococcota bacterium]
MLNEVTLAGFGGQGIMTTGKFLAEAALEQGHEVAWVPSYGPEMRGGTAYCTVVISDRPVGSPIVNTPNIIVAMNLPSYEKFENAVKPGGLLLINSSLMDVRSERTDITQVHIPCNQISIDLSGSGRSANISVLGALIGCTNLLPWESIERVVTEKFAKKPKVLEMNLKILRRGYDLGVEGLKGS